MLSIYVDNDYFKIFILFSDLFILHIFFEMEFCSGYPGNGAISAHRNLRLLGSGNSPASASWVAGIQARATMPS